MSDTEGKGSEMNAFEEKCEKGQAVCIVGRGTAATVHEHGHVIRVMASRFVVTTSKGTDRRFRFSGLEIGASEYGGTVAYPTCQRKAAKRGPKIRPAQMDARHAESGDVIVEYDRGKYGLTGTGYWAVVGTVLERGVKAATMATAWVFKIRKPDGEVVFHTVQDSRVWVNVPGGQL